MLHYSGPLELYTGYSATQSCNMLWRNSEDKNQQWGSNNAVKVCEFYFKEF